MSDNNTTPSYQNNVKELVQQLGEMLPPDKFTVFNRDAEQLANAHGSPLKLKKGDQAPMFSLPNAGNKLISLEDLLEQGSVVLTFYRGAWCPYCNLELKNYQQILSQIEQAGAKFVAISPMSPDNSLQMIDANALQYEVLSDKGSEVANMFTTVIENPQSSIQAMSDLGYDFHGFYNDDSTKLPIPAVFVISKEGVVLFADSQGGDYRKRVEPQKILDILA